MKRMLLTQLALSVADIPSFPFTVTQDVLSGFAEVEPTAAAPELARIPGVKRGGVL